MSGLIMANTDEIFTTEWSGMVKQLFIRKAGTWRRTW